MKIIKNINELSRLANAIYQSNINNIDLNRCKCPHCKATGNYEIKGYYYRNIIFRANKIELRITRVRCCSCNKTHALFFEDIIPYYPLTSIESLELYLHLFDSLIYDSEVLHRLKKRFSMFITYLKSVNGSINDIQDSNDKTMESMSKSYLQIHLGLIRLAT